MLNRPCQSGLGLGRRWHDAEVEHARCGLTAHRDLPSDRRHRPPLGARALTNRVEGPGGRSAARVAAPRADFPRTGPGLEGAEPPFEGLKPTVEDAGRRVLRRWWGGLRRSGRAPPVRRAPPRECTGRVRRPRRGASGLNPRLERRADEELPLTLPTCAPCEEAQPRLV